MSCDPESQHPLTPLRPLSQEDSWAADPNAFVADEDDEMMSYNVRSASLDLAQSLVETFSGSALAALQSAFQAVAASADQLRAQGDEDWWKGYESALAVVGAISEDLIEHVQESSEEGKAPKFALDGVFQGVVMTYLTATGAFRVGICNRVPC